MIKNYTTKDIKKSTEKTTPKRKDGDIFKDGDIWKFKWKGSECGFLTKNAAEIGLRKVSGKAKTKIQDKNVFLTSLKT